MDSKDTQCYKCRGYGHIAVNCTNGMARVTQRELVVLAAVEEAKGISSVITVKRRGTFPRTALLAGATRRRDALTVDQQVISRGIANVCDVVGWVEKDDYGRKDRGDRERGGDRDRNRNRDVECYQCHKSGHIARDCTEKG